jgi:hypothetical protein
MLTRREATALCLAAATAPVVNSAAFGLRLWLVTAVVSYLAAFVLGAPLFAYLRHRCWPLASRSLVAAVVAGVLAAGSLVTLVLVAFPPRDFWGDPEPTLSLIGIAATWGLGLGLIAGVSLWVLLRRGPALPSGA